MKTRKKKSVGFYLYQKFIEPKSENPDDRRREYIFNVIFAGLSVISITGLIASIINHLIGIQAHHANSVAIDAIFVVAVLVLFGISRRGLYKMAAFSVIGLLSFVASYLLITWSFELPIAELTFVLVIVISSILFRATTALLIGLSVSVFVTAIGLLQVYGFLHPYTDWFNQPLKSVDVVGYVLFFVIIGIVTWLANKEIDNSLKRARTSEATLELERDSLEVKIIERTRALEQAQLVRVMELQRFAEFGRLSSGLLHDLANPLTVASMNLEQLGIKNRSVAIKRAVQSLHHIERYVETARMQLKSQGNLVDFMAGREIKQIISMVNHRAKESGLEIKFNNLADCRLYGDPVKFNQLVANLLINAIESYDNLPEKYEKRPITISLDRDRRWVKLIVHDWGKGLGKDELEKIFEPFYSTKSAGKRNMGIGLAMVERITKVDFNGRLKVNSSKRYGTRFRVCLASQSKLETYGKIIK